MPYGDDNANILALIEPVLPETADPPAMPNDWLAQRWSDINRNHFDDALPPVHFRWVTGTSAAARIDPPDVLLNVGLLQTQRPDNAITAVLLHAAACIHTYQHGGRAYGERFRTVANSIGKRMGWKAIGTEDEAKRWPIGF